jgi:HPr kinase/phosphorylase
MSQKITLHASCVSVNDKAVLIRGKPGSGKSDLALRLIDEGAALVSDDQTELHLMGRRIVAHAPGSIAGKLELRGYGIVTLPVARGAPLALIVDLKPWNQIERLPEPETRREQLFGQWIAHIDMDPAMASATARIRLVLALAGT